jgi:hypothetical protein
MSQHVKFIFYCKITPLYISHSYYKVGLSERLQHGSRFSVLSGTPCNVTCALNTSCSLNMCIFREYYDRVTQIFQNTSSHLRVLGARNMT